jgi:hypothetical protein
MSMAKRGVGRPRPERIRIPDGWAPPHLNISSSASALDLVLAWRCLEHAGRYAEAREVFNYLQNLAERPLPGKRFPVKRRR